MICGGHLWAATGCLLDLTRSIVGGGGDKIEPLPPHWGVEVDKGDIVKRVIIAPHMRCNAKCAHCCVSSHPRDERQLADEDVLRLVDEAIIHPEVEIVSFTGGEALLRREFLLELIKRVTKSGKQTTLVSNGFWGVTPRIAFERLSELRDSGLTLLTLSADVFHTPYIPPIRIKNILDARHLVPQVQINLNMCESKSDNADLVLAELGDSINGVRVTRFPITPVGAATRIPVSDIVYQAYSTDDLRCPGQTLLFSSDDRVYPCCSTGVMNSTLSIGRASELSVSEGARRIRRNLIFQILSKEGLGWIVEQYKKLGIEKFQEPFPVVDACHLCCEVFTDPEDLARLRPALAEYRDAYLRETRTTPPPAQK